MNASRSPGEWNGKPAASRKLPPAAAGGAPVPAWEKTNPAGLSATVKLHRLFEPRGSIPIHAGADIAISVRINLLARRGVGGPDSDRLKQCLAPDYLMVLAPGRSATVSAHAAQEILLLKIAPSHFEAIAGHPASDITTALDGQIIADRVVTGMVEQLADPHRHSGKLNASLLKTIVLSLVERAFAKASKIRRGGLSAKQLATLRNHVESRLPQPMRNSELARLIGLSPFHFARAFKESMGLAPAAWIRLRRLSVGKTLLSNPELSITDVAAAVGYESPSRFAKAFRNVTGLSPTEHRRSIARQTA